MQSPVNACSHNNKHNQQTCQVKSNLIITTYRCPVHQFLRAIDVWGFLAWLAFGSAPLTKLFKTKANMLPIM